MKYISLTKEQKKELIKINSKISIKETNIRLKKLLKENNINSLRKFNNYKQLHNHLYNNPFELLTEINNYDKNINDKTRQHNKSFIKPFKNYQGNLNDKDKLNEFINKFFKSDSVKGKILNVLIKYFESVNEKPLKDYFYDIRGKIMFKE